MRYPTADEMARSRGSLVRETAAPCGIPRSDPVPAVDAATYEDLLYRMDIIESSNAGLLDVAAGCTIAHDEAVAFLREHIPG